MMASRTIQRSNHSLSLLTKLISIITLSVLISACAGSDGNTTSQQQIETKQNCDNTQQSQVALDAGQKGPWPVGRFETVIDRGSLSKKLQTQVWYPATIGSQQNQQPIRYDIRRFLKPADAVNVPDSEDPYLYCDCYDQLPLDTNQGKFPVIVYIHGTGGFSEVAISQMTHWASRGFIVIAANHPQIQLSDILNNGIFSVLFANQALDLKYLIEEVHNPDKLQQFSQVMDSQRIGVIGHSAGAIALENAASSEGVQVIIPQAGNTEIKSGDDLQSIMVMGAYQDSVIDYSGQVASFEQSSAAKKRLVGVANAGHMLFSEICAVKQPEGGIFAVAEIYNVKVPSIIKRFASDGCSLDQIPPNTGIDLVTFVTTAAFEETLKCSTSASQQLNIAQSLFENIATFKQEFTDAKPMLDSF